MTGIFGAHRAHGPTPDPAQSWHANAGCRTANAEIFFPVTKGQEQLAQAFCENHCDVQDKCAAWAIAHGVTDGVWGGMSEDELQRRVREAGTARRLEPSRHGSCARGHTITRGPGSRCAICNNIGNAKRKARAC